VCVCASARNVALCLFLRMTLRCTQLGRDRRRGSVPTQLQRQSGETGPAHSDENVFTPAAAVAKSNTSTSVFTAARRSRMRVYIHIYTYHGPRVAAADPTHYI
jgi:hypothetical protein